MRTANWPDAQRDADSVALSIMLYASVNRDSARRMQATVTVAIFIPLLWRLMVPTKSIKRNNKKGFSFYFSELEEMQICGLGSDVGWQMVDVVR